MCGSSDSMMKHLVGVRQMELWVSACIYLFTHIDAELYNWCNPYPAAGLEQTSEQQSR